ncbi:hypothetical protein QQS21_004270 [Conoideocrella luteorostrata]|uniref:BHLH domain-containing protein n=1 Tax=Conoideocrella luteorostrata TaxID=1105319 RepID=A0AAJ0CRK9_9HYPO|nr:hypothetical protein QQS21_004270 [Conoideocrella luteorostrata]
MNENGGREQSVSSMDQDISSSRHTSQPAQATTSWSGGSAGLGTFNFTSAPSAHTDVSIPSFDPAIAAFADLSFTQQAARSMPEAQPDALQGRDCHDKKRMKVESDTPALDSIDYWISFDDDLDKMGSFEIDYSKRPDLLNQNRPGITSESIPGLGSGLYSTATAPFREEDFFDDSAFEQVLSDDEEMFESTTDIKNKSVGFDQALKTEQPTNNDTSLSNTSPDVGKFHPSLGLATTAGAAPRQMRNNEIAQGPEFDEQRRFLEEALNSGRIPGALIPPNGFGIGFGAGMGAGRPPQEFENNPQSPRSQPSERQDKSRSAKNSDLSEEPDCRKQTKRAPAARPGTLRKTTAPGGAPKARSADRIAHNDVERKYRTNLKDKIAELRAAVPALHASGADGDSEPGSAGGQQSGAKISKVR